VARIDDAVPGVTARVDCMRQGGTSGGRDSKQPARALPERIVRALFQVIPMQIQFPNEAPEYSGRELTLAFPAMIDGQRVECMITAEALEDHFGAASPRLEDMVVAFDAHRERIEAATRRLLSETRAQCVVLRSGYVRFYEANWRN
jgi:hypothetical protein